MTSYIADLLRQTVAPRVSGELQPHLRRFYGGIIRGYLPQVWWFVTETGSATLSVDKSGAAHILENQVGQPDVTVVWNDRDAFSSLTSPNRGQIPPGTAPPQVQIYTTKGKAAYDQLRKRLGL